MSDNNLLDVLTREGVLISVSVRYWRAAKKLKAEDLGLDADNVTARLISLGHKKLLPRESLARFALIESRAHAAVGASTFPFLNGIAHFLPNRKLEAVTATLRGLQAEFREAQWDFVSCYGMLRRDACREWWEAARKLVKDPDRLVATIEASFPPVDRVGEHFMFDVDLFQIRVPDRLGVELVAFGEQQAIADARNEAARLAAQKIGQDAERFVSDCVATMRQETVRICDEMLLSMKGGKTDVVHQKTLNRLLAFIEQFKALNFAGDRELETILERARTELLGKTAQAYRDSAGAQAQLRQGLQDLARTAREMAREDVREIVERFGEMGVRKFAAAA